MTVGEAIKVLRKSRGLSQMELANRANVTRVSLCRWERGNRHMTVGTLFKLADALGADPADIIKMVRRK